MEKKECLYTFGGSVNSFKSQTIKLLQANTGKTLQNAGLGENYLINTPQAQVIKAKMDKLITSRQASSEQRKLSRKLRDNPQNGRKYLQTTHLTRD